MSTLLDSASLVVTPNAHKTSKLYSIVPSDGTGDFTATRTGDTATRVNSSGVIEINRTNNLLQSNNFGTTWTLLNASLTTSQADPLGGTTATKLVDNTTNGLHYVTQSVTTVAAIYSFSVYVKAAEYSQFQIFHRSGVSTNFNLSTLTTTTNGSISASIESIGGGWYRCTSSASMTAATNTQRILILDDTGTASFAGTGSKGILIWRSQLELGDLPTTYINTTTAAVTSGNVLANVPRIDYTNGGCPQLLIEPSRTNLFTYSGMIDQASLGNITVSKNQITSPSGMQSADLLLETTANSTHFFTKTASATSGTTYTYSIFVKKYTRRYVAIQFSSTNSVFTNQFVSFDLDTASIATNASNLTASIVPYANGWYRISATATAAATATGTFAFLDLGNTNSVSSFVGSVTDGVYAWGGQIEAGSYPTSLIQTFNASVTRNEDLIVNSTATSLIGQTDGTIFLNASLNGTNSVARNITLSDGTSTNRIILNFGNNGANLIQCELIAGGVAQVSGLQTTIDMTNEFKLAYAYSTNNFRLYLNGTLIATDTSGSTFSGTTLSRVAFTTFNGTSQSLDGKVKSFALWKTALSNADLASLTTL